MPGLSVLARPFTGDDREWVEMVIGVDFAGRMRARRGELIDVLAPGLIAERDGDRIGVLMYREEPEVDAAEIVYLQVTETGTGIGSELLAALLEIVDAQTIWVVTTNDNLDALGFYQRRGFAIREIRVGAVTAARQQLKPTIPETAHGIPIRDEIELELRR